MRKTAKKGDKRREIYTASLYNKLSKGPLLRTGIPSLTSAFNSIVVNGTRTAGSAAKRFDAVGITGIMSSFTDIGDLDEILGSNAVNFSSDTLDLETIGIALAPTPEIGDPSPVLINGLCWIRCLVKDVNDTHVDIEADEAITSSSGMFIVDKAPDWVVEEWNYALVLFRGGKSGDCVTVKTPTDGVDAASGDGTSGNPYIYGTASCDLINPLTRQVYDPTKKQAVVNIVDVKIGGDVIAKAEKVGADYIIDVAGCPAGPPVGPVEV